MTLLEAIRRAFPAPGLPDLTRADVARVFGTSYSAIKPEGWHPNPAKLAGYLRHAAAAGFRFRVHIVVDEYGACYRAERL